MVVLACCLTACEKAVVADEAGTAQADANVVLRVAGFDVLPFDTRNGSADLRASCSRLNFAIYSGGKKLKGINQKAEEEAFGEVALKLDEGDYQLLVVAHSSAGNPTMSTPEKVQFTNADGFTDTFYYYGTLTVGASNQTYDVTLKRAVAMFRLVTEDGKPADVKSMRFYYTGGSGALNAVTGFGCVNSQQTVVFDLDDATDGQPLRLETYTFPHAETGTLKMLVTALDASGNALYTKEFADVPIEQNKVTQYTGRFFVSDTTGEETQDRADRCLLRIESAWNGTNEYGF